MSNTKAILGQGAFWILNKKITKEVGLEASLLLSHLISKEDYFENEWFFSTAETIEDELGLSPHIQRKAINTLKEAGFIKTRLYGIPRKQYFKVVHSLLLKFLTTGSENSSQLYKENQRIKSNSNGIHLNEEQEMNMQVNGLIKHRRELKWSTPFKGAKEEPRIAKNLLQKDDYRIIIKLMTEFDEKRGEDFMPTVNSLEDFNKKYPTIKAKLGGKKKVF